MLMGLCSQCFFAQHEIIICHLLALSLVMPEGLSVPYKYPALKSRKQSGTISAARAHTQSLEHLQVLSQ